MDGDKQPIFNAPWPAVLIAVVMLAVYGGQSFLPPEQILPRWAFSARALDEGRYETLVSSLFLSDGWTQALISTAFALAFGAPVARLFGGKFAGGAAFILFCLTGGGLANLGYGLAHPGAAALLVGATGITSALMGASARILAGQGQVGPILSSPVLSLGIGWTVVHLIAAVVSISSSAGGAPLAWEVAPLGFLAGALLLGPFAWLARQDISH